MSDITISLFNIKASSFSAREYESNVTKEWTVKHITEHFSDA